MTAATRRRGGSFNELRDRHLFLFEGERVIHFLQRGDTALVRHESGRPGTGRPPKWVTAGIFHYPAPQSENAALEDGTSATACGLAIPENEDDRLRRRARADDRADDPAPRAY